MALGAGRDRADGGALPPLPAFPIAYYDDQHLFSSLLPHIEARLPLETVSIRCPLSPNVPLQCSGLRLEFLPHDEPRFEGLLPPATSSSSSTSVSSLSASSVAMKAAFASIAGVAAHVPLGGATAVGGGPTDTGSGVAAGTGTSGSGSHRPSAAHEAHADRPFIYLQILQLEGMDDYKTHHRRMLKAWVDSLTEQHEEWLVLYVTPFSDNDSQNKSFKKLLDKLRSDLNPQGSRNKERFLRLPTDATGNYASSPAFADLWNIFMARLKEALVASVETRSVQLEDEIQRQSQVAEPRFCPLFVAKENLARLHERCNRLEDALAVYDTMDLGNTTRQGSPADVKQCHSLFISFGFETPDDQVPLFFDPARLHKLHAQLREDTLSYVQFRQYLFARQADLLVRLQRVEELSARGVEMTSSLHKEIVAEGFKVSGNVWAVLACVNLAHFIVTKSISPPGFSPSFTGETPSRSSSHPTASHTPVSSSSSSSSSALLNLKRPGFAVSRTLHRLTPLQFSLSPTRRLHSSQRTNSPVKDDLAGGKAASASSPSSPALAGAASRRGGLGGAQGGLGDPGAETAGGADGLVGGASGILGGGAAASRVDAGAGTVPAARARSAAHLYAYGAQQLQRLIAWREREKWSLPLLEFPHTASREQGSLKGSMETGSQDMSGSRARSLPAADVDCAKEEAGSPARFPSSLSKAPKGGEEASEERGYTRSSSSPFAGLSTPPSQEDDNGFALAFSLPWWLCTKAELLEELRTLSDAEELLVHVFVLAGQQYVNCGYFRHAALLQFRLASAHFKRRDLDDCRKALSKMLPLFVKEPWTALWVQCQQLMAEASTGLGHADALASSYFLANANAVPGPSFFSSSHGGGRARLSLGAAERVELGPSAQGEPKPGEAGDADASFVQRERDSSISTMDTEALLPPQAYLERFISLAQKKRDFHEIDLGDDAGETAGTPHSSSCAGEQNAACGSGAGDSTSAFSEQASAVPAGASAQQGSEPRGRRAKEEREIRARATQTDSFEAAAWLGPDAPSVLKQEGQIYIRAAPNLYCWGALKPALVGLRSNSEREKVCRMRPALALASVPQLGPLEALASSHGLYQPYGSDDTPCTVAFVTPTAASGTHRAHMHGPGATSSNPFAALLKTSSDGRAAGVYGSSLYQTPRHLARGSADGLGDARGARGLGSAYLASTPSSTALPLYYGGGAQSPGTGGSLYGASVSSAGLGFRSSSFSRHDGRDNISTGFLSGSSARGGATGSAGSQASGLFGNLNQELLEQAVLRQLVDLLPLYRLPCHPELEPQNACLLAYAATLERVKPKSTAQVLGQLQQRRFLPAFNSPSLRDAAGGDGAARRGDGALTTEHSSWSARGKERPSQTVGGERGQAGADSKEGRSAELDGQPAFRSSSEEPPKRPANRGEDGGSGLQGASGPEGSGDKRGKELKWTRSRTLTELGKTLRGETCREKDSGNKQPGPSVPGSVGGAAGAVPAADKGGEESHSPHPGPLRGRVSLLLSTRRRSSAGPSTATEDEHASACSGMTARPTASPVASSTETLSVNSSSAKSGPVQRDAASTGGLPSEASTVRSAVPSAPGSGAVSDRDGAHPSSPGLRVAAAPARPGQSDAQRDGGSWLPSDRETQPHVLTSSAASRGLAGQFRVHGQDSADGGWGEPRSSATDVGPAGAVPPRGDTVGSPGSGRDGVDRLAHSRTRPQPLRESEMAAGVEATVPPQYRSSRALSVLQMGGSLQAAVPSLSVSLGQCVELRLHVHSSIAGPVEADAIALRLSQLPFSDVPPGAGGSMRQGPGGAGSVGTPSVAGLLGGGGIARTTHFEETQRQAPTSVWLVLRPAAGGHRVAEVSDTAEKTSEESSEEDSAREGRQARESGLKLQPGMNLLSLFWSSRFEGVFVLEQVCVVVGAVVLVQWAGELPPPGMIDEVRQAMQDVLLALPAEDEGGERRRCLREAEEGETVLQRARVKSAACLSAFPPEPVARKAAAKDVQQTASAACDAAVAAGRAAAETDALPPEKDDDRGGAGVRTSGALASPSVLPKGAFALASSGRHRRVSDKFSNPFFAFADWGDAAAALAFEDRMAPPTPACLLPGYAPCGATLVHPDAPLERMLRPLIFEFRPPATAVQMRIQPVGPNSSFLFLNARNHVKIRIDVLPGLLVFPKPARLRVLQCLLPAAAAASVIAEEDEDLIDEDLTSEHGGRFGLQRRLSAGGGSLADGSGAGAAAAGASPLRRGRSQAASKGSSSAEGESGSHGLRRDPSRGGAGTSVPSAAGVSSGVPAQGKERGEGLQPLDQNAEGTGRAGDRAATRASAVSFLEGVPSGSREGGSLLWGEGAAFAGFRGGSTEWTAPQSMGAGDWDDDEQVFEGAAVELNFDWENAMAVAVDDRPTRLRLCGGKASAASTDGGKGYPLRGMEGSSVEQQGHAREKDAGVEERSRRGEASPDESGCLGGDDCLSGEGEGAEGLPVLEQFDFIRIRAPAGDEGDVLALVPRRRPPPVRGAQLGDAEMLADPKGDSGEPHTPAESDSASSQGWLDLPKFCRSVEVLVPVVPVKATTVRPLECCLGEEDAFPPVAAAETEDRAAEALDGEQVNAAAAAAGAEGGDGESRVDPGAASASSPQRGRGPTGSPERAPAGASRAVGAERPSLSESRASSSLFINGVVPPLASGPARQYSNQGSSLFRWRATSWHGGDECGRGGGKGGQPGARERAFTTYSCASASAVRYRSSVSWRLLGEGSETPLHMDGRARLGDAELSALSGDLGREADPLAVTEDAAHVVASLQFYTSTGVDLNDRRRARRQRRRRELEKRRNAGAEDGAGKQGADSGQRAERKPDCRVEGLGPQEEDARGSALLGAFVPSVYCGGDDEDSERLPRGSISTVLQPHSTRPRLSGDRAALSDSDANSSEYAAVSVEAGDSADGPRKPKGDERSRTSLFLGSAGYPLARCGESISVTEGDIEGTRDLRSGEALEECFESITYSFSSTDLCRRRKLRRAKSKAPWGAEAGGAFDACGGSPASPLLPRKRETAWRDPDAREEEAWRSDCSASSGCHSWSGESGDGEDEGSGSSLASESETDGEAGPEREPQPVTILKVQTSRVYRLEVRPALSHACRSMHLSGGSVVHQIFLQSCAPAEAIVLDFATISPLTSFYEREERGRADAPPSSRDQGEPMQSRNTGNIRVSLIAPSPLYPSFFCQLSCQEEESVHLNTLLFGGQMTTVLVRLQHVLPERGEPPGLPVHPCLDGHRGPGAQKRRWAAHGLAPLSPTLTGVEEGSSPCSSRGRRDEDEEVEGREREAEPRDAQAGDGRQSGEGDEGAGPASQDCWAQEQGEREVAGETRGVVRPTGDRLRRGEDSWRGEEAPTNVCPAEWNCGASLTPRVEPYVLSLYYRFVQGFTPYDGVSPCGAYPHGPSAACGPSGRQGLEPPGSLAPVPVPCSPETKPVTSPPLGPGCWSGSAARGWCMSAGAAAGQEASSGKRGDRGLREETRQPLVYHIPLLLPVQKFPVEVNVFAPRTGRVSTPLFVSLVLTNCSNVRLQVCHSVSLEFDDAHPQRRPSARRVSALSSRGGVLAENGFASSSRLPFNPRLSGGGNSNEGEKEKERGGVAFGRCTNGRVPEEKPTRGPAGAAQTGAGASPRLGECHDWLMVGSKCRTTTLAGGGRSEVRFQLIPLRAGPLSLPAVRVYVRPDPDAGDGAAFGGQGARSFSRYNSHSGARGAQGHWEAELEKQGSSDSAASFRSTRLAGNGHNGGVQRSLTGNDETLESNGEWFTMPEGDSVTAGREVLVLPKVLSKPDLKLLPE
ncbi:hypothetical protein BESB_059220 [Besnoitia besnoiti]|uniref:TRAPPC10/Trs130 N-terminal domain-containing protein n=1 Tax=Besnoitia besnoiti TaxID=94643 RepID=A0A2A9MAM3_BESBE|nr:hypothetical protein BESB_059220 [Besnoitia besnoiti]PFH35035.1 hypothetical protein BESB_059220 [Besnoitia besnoiti]